MNQAPSVGNERCLALSYYMLPGTPTHLPVPRDPFPHPRTESSLASSPPVPCVTKSKRRGRGKFSCAPKKLCITWLASHITHHASYITIKAVTTGEAHAVSTVTSVETTDTLRSTVQSDYGRATGAIDTSRGKAYIIACRKSFRL